MTLRVVIGVAFLTSVVFGQLPQVDAPAATVLVQGQDPGETGDAATDAGNDIQVILPGTLVLTHQSTNPNVPIVLTASIVDLTTGGTTVINPLPFGSYDSDDSPWAPEFHRNADRFVDDLLIVRD